MASSATGGGGGHRHHPSQGQKRTFSIMSDAEFKERGNRCFAARKYDEAIQCYSNAIQKNPSNPIYFTNRALAALR